MHCNPGSDAREGLKRGHLQIIKPCKQGDYATPGQVIHLREGRPVNNLYSQLPSMRRHGPAGTGVTSTQDLVNSRRHGGAGVAGVAGGAAARIGKSLPHGRRKLSLIMKFRPVCPVPEEEFPCRGEFAAVNSPPGGKSSRS